MLISAQIAVAAAVKAGWFGNGVAANAAGAGVGAAAAYIISAGINDLFADDDFISDGNEIIHLTKLIKNHMISIPSKLQQKTKNHFITIHNDVRFKDIANIIANIIEIKPSLNSILNLNSSIFIANDNFLKVQDFIIKQEIRL